MPVLTKLEKLWFPGFIVALQIVMLILFGTLVEYDELASPVTTNDPAAIPDSNGDTQTFYPRKCDCSASVHVCDRETWLALHV